MIGLVINTQYLTCTKGGFDQFKYKAEEVLHSFIDRKLKMLEIYLNMKI